MGKEKQIGYIVKAFLVSVLVTILILIVFALLMLQMGIDNSVISKMMIAGYILAPATGGFFLGKKKKEKRYLWGLLIGGLYFTVFFLISVLSQNTEPAELLWTAIPMVIGGMAGGMLS